MVATNITDRLNGAISSLALKAPCAAVATTNITLSGTQTIGAVAVVVDDRVLVTAQTNAVENGIYNAATGAWSRAADFDGNRDVVEGTLVTVNKTTGQNFFYQVDTSGAIVIGTTNISLIAVNDPNVSWPIIQAELDQSLTTSDINDSYEPADARRYSLSADGSTDDAALINKIYAAAAGLTVRWENGKDYAVASQITIPGNNIRIISNGAKFTLTTTIAGNNPVMLFNAGGRHVIDKLEVAINTGVTVDRVVQFGSPGSCGEVKVTSVDQQNNRTDSLDAAVRVLGNDFTLFRGNVDNFDNAYEVYNCNRVRLGLIYATSYVRGMHFDTVDDLEVGLIRVKTASANASTTSGHNGVLFEDVQNAGIGKLDVGQAGEHGVRFGSGTAASAWIHIDSVHSFESGQCGFKINDTNTAHHISVGQIFAIDNADTTTAGTNEDGVRIERANDIQIGTILVDVQNNAKSGFDGMYINAVNGLTVGEAVLRLCDNKGVQMIDTNGPLREIIFGSLIIIDCDDDAVEIDSTTENLADIHINNFYARDYGVWAIDLNANSGTVGATQPCTFTGKVREGGSGVVSSNTTDPDIQFDIVGAEQYELATGTFTASVYIKETRIDSSGGAVGVTLPDGKVTGQRKIITMSDATTSSTLTVTTHLTSAPEVFTFAQTTDVLILEWTGALWYSIKNMGAAT